ncbi:MAG: acetylornithine deacetylase [Patescibacteria group bacterium]
MNADVIDVLRRLIGMNTVSHRSTREIADFVCNYLEPFGFTIEQHVYRLKDVEKKADVEKVNVIARKGGDDLHLALAGHMDTVPFKQDEWRTDPLELTKMGDKWFGRGTCDMKGFLALAMIAGSRISVSQLKRPFGLVFTSDEEVGCIGAKKLIRDKGRVAEMYIIGEPTEFQPFILHKGYMYISIELRGKGGHGSRPADGINAVERGLLPILGKIEKFKRHLGDIVDIRLDPPYPTLNIGVVSTGENSAKNMIADYCRVELEIRPVPGQDVHEMFHAFSNYLTDGEERVDGVGVKVAFKRAPTPPMETSREALVVREVERMCGHTACSTSFNTEGGVFNASGAHSVICGLGSIQQAHQPNEFVHEKYLTDAMVEKYIATILNICGKEV